MSAMRSLMTGFQRHLRVWPGGNPARLQGSERYHPRAIDLLCRVRGGALTASGPQMATPAGCPFVMLAVSATDAYAEEPQGQLPPVAIASNGAANAVVGVLMWDKQAAENATVPDDSLVWVRIAGVHEYALLNGSGTAIAASDMLTNGAGGKGIVRTSGTQSVAVALAAVSADSYGKVHLLDPLGFALGAPV